jgi:superoxide dismutase
MDLRSAVNLVESAQKQEPIKMSPLPYKKSALEPALSEQNVNVHYNILTKKYFTKYAETGDLFQKAGALLHNDYYWACMQPYDLKNKPSTEFMNKIEAAHGSLSKMQDAWLEAALKIQGNGWVFLMTDLQIQTVQNHVLKAGIILAYDQWEHSLTDYDFDREKALKQWWNVVNWSHVEELSLS